MDCHFVFDRHISAAMHHLYTHTGLLTVTITQKPPATIQWIQQSSSRKRWRILYWTLLLFTRAGEKHSSLARTACGRKWHVMFGHLGVLSRCCESLMLRVVQLGADAACSFNRYCSDTTSDEMRRFPPQVCLPKMPAARCHRRHCCCHRT